MTAINEENSPILTSLANIDKAKKLIEESKNITEVLEIREKAIAVHAYAQARKSDDLARVALVVKLRTERKAGQFLAEMKDKGELLHGGQNKKAKMQRDFSLSDLKVNNSESSRWQRLAMIPELKFETWVKDKAFDASQRKLLKQATFFIKEETQSNGIAGFSAVPLPPNINLIKGKFQDVKSIAENSVQLMFTDPPYGAENLSIYEDLGVFAKKHLVEHGSLVTFINEGELDVILDILRKHLDFWAILTVKMSGPYARMWKQGLVVKCKHLLWMVKGDQRLFPKQTIDNLIESSIPDKTYHEWAQSTKEGEFIIRCLTSQDGIVCDPFLGQGTFGISAKNTGRSFIGIEMDERHYENAKKIIGLHNT